MLHEDLSNYKYSDTLVGFSDRNAIHNSGYDTITSRYLTSLWEEIELYLQECNRKIRSPLSSLVTFLKIAKQNHGPILNR